MESSKNNMKLEQSYDTWVYSLVTPPDRCTKRLLNVTDTLISLFIISPLVVTHWRGTWTFMDHHMEYFPPWHTFIFGAVLHTTLVLLRELLHAKLKTNDPEKKTRKRTIFKAICTKIYLYIFSLGCILNWRGGWAVLQIYFGKYR